MGRYSYWKNEFVRRTIMADLIGASRILGMGSVGSYALDGPCSAVADSQAGLGWGSGAAKGQDPIPKSGRNWAIWGKASGRYKDEGRYGAGEIGPWEVGTTGGWLEWVSGETLERGGPSVEMRGGGLASVGEGSGGWGALVAPRGKVLCGSERIGRERRATGRGGPAVGLGLLYMGGGFWMMRVGGMMGL